jgi:Na+/H+-dicarboxylate symporter
VVAVKLHTKIFIGLVVGAVLGVALSLSQLGSWGGYLKPFGDAFVNLIKMIVIPLVMASIMLGVTSLGDVRRLGRIGAKTILFYAVATALAVAFGLLVANIFRPGSGIDPKKRDEIIAKVQEDESFKKQIAGAAAASEVAAAAAVINTGRKQTDLLEELGGSQDPDRRNELALTFRREVLGALTAADVDAKEGESPDLLLVDGKPYLILSALGEPGAEVSAQFEPLQRTKGPGQSIGDILIGLIPTNPIEAMAAGNMLPIIIFSILFAIALTMVRAEPRNTVVGVLEGVNDSMIVLVNMIMRLAPYGVAAIIAAVTAQLGLDFLVSLVRYAAITVGTMAVFYVVFYSFVVAVFARMSPWRFFKAMRPVGLIAFTTCSSNATLPENMLVCEKDLGAPKEVVSFALPLGATINMNGTAIYQGISVMFIAQVYGLDLTLTEQLTVVLTASLASVGAAGVPMIGMVTLALVLASVGLPATGIALVLGVERILDMCRTVLNVTGDAAAAVIVGHSEGGLKPQAEVESAEG